MLLYNLNNEKNKLPDVFFLDVNMPGKNGYECLLEMKSIERLANIPIAIYTNTYHIVMADLYFRAGANFFIKKPFRFKDVKKAIERVLCFVSENANFHPQEKTFLLQIKREIIFHAHSY